MQSNWLYDRSALLIVAVLVAAMLLGFELAYRAGRRWHAATPDAGREVFVAIKVSVLGLLALLLAFAFGMAAERYADRQRLVADEANVLHRVMLYGSLLPEPDRAQFQNTLLQLVDARLAFFNARRNLAGVAEAVEGDRRRHAHCRLFRHRHGNGPHPSRTGRGSSVLRDRRRPVHRSLIASSTNTNPTPNRTP